MILRLEHEVILLMYTQDLILSFTGRRESILPPKYKHVKWLCKRARTCGTVCVQLDCSPRNATNGGKAYP